MYKWYKDGYCPQHSVDAEENREMNLGELVQQIRGTKSANRTTFSCNCASEGTQQTSQRVVSAELHYLSLSLVVIVQCSNSVATFHLRVSGPRTAKKRMHMFFHMHRMDTL